MQQIGYSLVDQNGSEVAFWGDMLGSFTKPDRVVLPNGDIVEGISGPATLQQWRLVPRMGQRGNGPTAWDGDNVVVSFPVTTAEIVAERSRRFAMGFSYTFPDPPAPQPPDLRGTIHIGTSPQDMIGWDDVTMLANALINAGYPDGQITIVPESSPIQITAMEWQHILLAGAVHRQLLWAKSFEIQAMDPVPANYSDDSYWE